MGLTYFDAIISRFGENEFSVKDLTNLTGNSRSSKLLSEMKMRGIVERIGRGKYRVLSISERSDRRLIEWERIRMLIIKAPWKKAWAGSTAVEIWTDGKYKVSPNLYLKVFHLLINKSELEEWKRYLTRFGVSFSGKKRVGACVVLESSPNVDLVTVAGEPVIPKDDVLRLIRSHPGLYAGAEDLIEY